MDSDTRKRLALLLEARDIKVRILAPASDLEDCTAVAAERGGCVSVSYVPDYAFEDDEILEGMAEVIEMDLEEKGAAP